MHMLLHITLHAGITFIEQPANREVYWGIDMITHFPCNHRGSEPALSQLIPKWRINFQDYDDRNLPQEYYTFNSSISALTVNNIGPDLNNSHYQCFFLLPDPSTDQGVCIRRSTVGVLLIRQKGILYYIPHIIARSSHLTMCDPT